MKKGKSWEIGGQGRGRGGGRAGEGRGRGCPGGAWPMVAAFGPVLLGDPGVHPRRRRAAVGWVNRSSDKWLVYYSYVLWFNRRNLVLYICTYVRESG